MTDNAAEQKAQPGTFAKAIDIVAGGWFTELGSMWPGQGLSLQIKEVLYQARSEFQDVCVFETEAYGTVLTLDGVIQVTDRDEFSYQEMLTHLGVCALEEPAKKALVVGGGDGGVLRELARHPSLEEIHIAEIDGMVIDTAKKFFPQMALGFQDPRVTVNVTDGIKFVQAAPPDTYDIMIVDSSDPVGPAEVLFQKPFFEAMYKALKPGGIILTQAESLWLHLDVIKALAAMCKEVFAEGSVSYAFTTIPTYPSGQIGFMVCSKAKEGSPALDPRKPRQTVPVDSTKEGVPPIRYYSPEVHSAAFVLPKFAKDALAGSLTFQ